MPGKLCPVCLPSDECMPLSCLLSEAIVNRWMHASFLDNDLFVGLHTCPPRGAPPTNKYCLGPIGIEEHLELDLQIRCGDLYADKAVEAFTACAVSDKKCVPQRVDESTFPVPPDCALDQSFDLNNFQVNKDACAVKGYISQS